METQTEKTRGILDDLATVRTEIHSQAKGQSKGEVDLPEGSEPIEPSVEVAEGEGETKVESIEAAGTEEKAAPQEPEEEIIINGKVFKTQSEAIKYAESLEAEKLALESYNLGIKETLQHFQQPTAPVEPVEDNFETEFYTDPKGTLNKLKETAKQEILSTMKAQEQKEKLWNEFLASNPDIAREDAEMVLQRNMDTIGKITDLKKGMELLAVKTRSYYQSIIDRSKPRTELPQRKGQVVSPASSTQSSVTPQKKDEKPLSFSEEMKKMRKRV